MSTGLKDAFIKRFAVSCNGSIKSCGPEEIDASNCGSNMVVCYKSISTVNKHTIKVGNVMISIIRQI